MASAVSTTALFVRRGILHAAATIAAAVIITAWAQLSLGDEWAFVATIMAEAAIAYTLAWLWIGRRLDSVAVSVAAVVTIFLGELTLIAVAAVPNPPPLVLLTTLHVINLSLILWLVWVRQWQWVGLGAVVPAWLATLVWYDGHRQPEQWTQVMALATALYAVFALYPFVLGSRARESRDPYLTAIGGSVFFFFAARMALLQGACRRSLAWCRCSKARCWRCCCAQLLRIEPRGDRDLGRLALVAGIGARVRHGGDSAAANTVDHDRLGARRRGARLALSPHPASRPAVLGDGAARQPCSCVSR